MALLFLHGQVLKVDLPWLQEIGRPKPTERLPTLLTVDGVSRTLLRFESSQLVWLGRATVRVYVPTH